MEGNNLPLALNPWADPSAPNSYRAANEAVDTVFDPEQDDFLKIHEDLADFTKCALYGIIRGQSERNFEQYRRVERHLTPKHDDYVHGFKSPAELTLFLHATPALESIEVGRRTDKRWSIFNDVDAQIRSDLDEHPLLYTKAIKSESLYRVKNLNLVGSPDQNYVLVDRKRTVRQHFGGKVLTIVRNSFVLHNHVDDEALGLPRDIRKFIHEARDAARYEEYVYNQHVPVMHEHLEDYFRHRSSVDRPAYVMPLMTTYYAAKREAISTEQLLRFSEAKTEEIT